MTVSQYLNFTIFESTNIFFTWSANLPQIKQVEIQQILSNISTFNIGEYYKVPINKIRELDNYEIIAQKLNADGSLFLMLN